MAEAGEKHFGQSLEEWTSDLQSKSVEKRRFAALALGHMGIKARASLEPIKGACADQDLIVRKAALRALSRVSPRDDKTLLILLRALDDKNPELVDGAILAVAHYARVHPKMFPNLLIRKDTEDLERRRRVYRALGLLYSQRYDVIPKLIESLADPDPEIRKIIIGSIVDLDPDSLSIVRALMIMLRDPDRTVREMSMRQIARLGPKAVAATPWLMKILKTQKFSEYREASRTLGAIGEGAFQEVLKLSKDGDADLKARGIRALGAFGDRGAKELLVFLQSPDVRIRSMAVMGFSSHAKLSAATFQSLVKVFQNTEDEEIQGLVLKVLRFSGERGVDSLITLLKDPNTVPIAEVIKTLAWIGIPARKAFGAIKAFRKDPKLKPVVEQALAKIGAPSAAETSFLLTLYNNPELRPQVIHSLGSMGKNAASAVQRLCEELKNTKPDHRKRAVKSLGRLGKTAQSAITPIIELAKSEPSLAVDCFEALTKIGSSQLDDEKTKALQSFFSHKNESLRLHAIIALVALKDDAVPVLELKALLDSKDARVAFVAARSLARLGQHSPRVLAMLEANLSVPAFRHSAIKSLRSLESKADFCIPKIAELLELENVALTVAILDLMPSLGPKSELLVPFLNSAVQSDSLTLRLKTIERLGSMGVKAKQALPILIESLTDKDCRSSLFSTLKLIGMDPLVSTPALIPLLDHSDPVLVKFARGKLFGFGPQTLPALIKTIDGIGISNGLRAKALRVCAQLPKKDLEAMLPQFINALFYVGASFREAMALVLKKIGAKSVLPLTRQFDGGYWRRRQNAAYCLGELGQLAVNAAPVLIKASKDKEGGVRVEAYKALAKLGPGIGDAILNEVSAEPDKSQRALLRIFATWKEKSKPYLPRLAALIEPKTHSDTVLGILRCFSAVPSEKRSYVPSLVVVLDDPRAELTLGALDLIHELKIADPKLFPKVKANLDSKDRAIKVRATELLSLFGDAAMPRAPQLIKGFQHPNKLYRQACSNTLSNLGKTRPQLAKLVAKELKSKEWIVRAYAARCLGNMGAAGSVAVENLKMGIEDEDPRVRWSTVKALGQMGEKADGAVPGLISALLDEDEDVVTVAIVSLGKLGVKARKAIPTLKKIKKIASEEQLRAIEETLKILEAN